jgi:hypothetical protein
LMFDNKTMKTKELSKWHSYIVSIETATNDFMSQKIY